ncbi:MAG: rtcB [Chlamydiales bacterium]|jgi:tRNA-splicing ligase RtcB|nr:rtcB [Chlamydiales bacterium]
MKAIDLRNYGIPKYATKIVGESLRKAVEAGINKKDLHTILECICDNPLNYINHPHFSEVANILLKDKQSVFKERDKSASYISWGEGLDEKAHEQMRNACRLPVAVKGALMPDAHTGYGLPIGGVLATRNAVIPYAVGVDIACRMKLSIFDAPISFFEENRRLLTEALEQQTRFGFGIEFKKNERRIHSVMDEPWHITRLTSQLKDKAWAQLGTSGTGNHFVEFGIFTLKQPDLGIPAGDYLALLSHSGSRGAGAQVANYYSALAQKLHPELPPELKHLAWLDLSSEAGQEYWNAMELMGKYAAANHSCIHDHVSKAIKASVLTQIENHHNFAWKEIHDGEELIVHRKGATPANKDVLGIIPGSMATPAYIVRGKGSRESLHSASHGAGRKMSRTQAKKQFSWEDAMRFIKSKGVKLLSSGLDEVPMAYKDIEEVIAAQLDLVEIIGQFHPKIVKMAPDNEPPED